MKSRLIIRPFWNARRAWAEKKLGKGAIIAGMLIERFENGVERIIKVTWAAKATKIIEDHDTILSMLTK